jgi:hypothetical protein
MVAICSLIMTACMISCGKDEKIDELPKVVTKEVSATRTRSAVGGGVVESSGVSDVTQRGVCWGLNQNPTLADSYTVDSNGLGSFTSNLTGLNPNTEYYVRAYAVNNFGISYGNQVFFKTQEEIIPDENFWYIDSRPFISNALGSFWTPTQKSFGSLSSEGGAISITFKNKPITGQSYKVLSFSVLKDQLLDDECSIILIAPGFGDGLVGSSGNSVATVQAEAVDSKIQLSFNDIEVEYNAGGAVQKASLRGVLLEK